MYKNNCSYSYSDINKNNWMIIVTPATTTVKSAITTSALTFAATSKITFTRTITTNSNHIALNSTHNKNRNYIHNCSHINNNNNFKHKNHINKNQHIQSRHYLNTSINPMQWHNFPLHPAFPWASGASILTTKETALPTQASAPRVPIYMDAVDEKATETPNRHSAPRTSKSPPKILPPERHAS